MRYLRWLLISLAAILVLGVSIFFVLRACGVRFTSGAHKVIASDDVIWLLPWEQGHYSEGAGFTYEGTSVSASEKGGILTVNGKYYGTLKIGDSVDLSTKGVVLVNGQPRQSP